MTIKKKVKVLSVFRSKFMSYNRGTPLRVRHIVTKLGKEEEIELTTSSWDESSSVGIEHIYLSNNHFDDLRKLYLYVKKIKLTL